MLLCGVENTKICSIDECSVCDDGEAICTTTDPSEIIPATLPNNTWAIGIKYYGPPQNISASSLSRFRNLKNFALEGHISAIKNETFASHTNLQYVYITQTNVDELPDDVFGDNSSVIYLNLTRNKLRRMPGKELLQSIQKVRAIDLSYNPIEDICLSQQLNKEFYNLKSLFWISFSGLGNRTSCSELPDNFFSPVSHISQLELTESGFFYGNQDILNVFHNLTELHINHVSPYTECPALAEELFSSLPASLRALRARNWQTSLPFNESCLLTSKGLRSLSQLPNLGWLDFIYNEQAFGKSLPSTLFRRKSSIQQLTLRYCGITDIKDGALDEAKELEFLELTGNSLGPREFKAVSNFSNPLHKLFALSLDNCDLSLDESFVYNGSFLFSNFPNVEELSLAGNNFYNLPHFLQQESRKYDFQRAAKLFSLDLSRNVISVISGDSIDNLCSAMPNLQSLDISKNSISTISHLCVSLTNLDMSNNLLWMNQDNNLAVIQSLRNLQLVDLSNNGLKSIPRGTFSSMALFSLNLRGNSIVHLDDQLFSGSYASLMTLDLSRNRIRQFNVSLISQHKYLRRLYLHDNLITELSKEFVSFADDIVKNRSDSYLKEQRYNITVHENPLDCSCGRLYFQNWVIRSPILYQPKELLCETPESQHAKKVYAYNDSLWDCKMKLPLAIVGAILLCIVCTVLIALPCYRFRWYISHIRVVCQAMVDRLSDIKQDYEYKYDVMICCNQSSEPDTKYAEDLLRVLEGEDHSEVEEATTLQHERVSCI